MSNSSREQTTRPRLASIVPTCRRSEDIAARVADRNQGLADHNRAATNLAGLAVFKMAERANGSTPTIRCDKSERVRRLELDGTLNLSVAAFCGIALENDLGRDVALDGLRVVAQAIGFDVVPSSDGPALAPEVAMSNVVRRLGHAIEVAGSSLEDGRVDKAEAEEFDRAVGEIERWIAKWRASRGGSK